jgi:hypothetical protein
MAKRQRKSSKGSIGNGSGSTISYSPGQIAGMEAAKVKTEAYWARRSGKVTTRVMTDEELREYRRKLADRRRKQR